MGEEEFPLQPDPGRLQPIVREYRDIKDVINAPKYELTVEEKGFFEKLIDMAPLYILEYAVSAIDRYIPVLQSPIVRVAIKAVRGGVVYLNKILSVKSKSL